MADKKLHGLLQQVLPVDWTPEEQLFFRNWLQQIVTLHETLNKVAKDRPRVLWRACKSYDKLRLELVRAAQAAETVEPNSGVPG